MGGESKLGYPASLSISRELCSKLRVIASLLLSRISVPFGTPVSWWFTLLDSWKPWIVAGIKLRDGFKVRLEELIDAKAVVAWNLDLLRDCRIRSVLIFSPDLS